MKRALTIGLHIRHKARLHGRLTDVEFHSASTKEEALQVLEGEESFDLLVVDESLSDAEAFLQKIKALKIPTIYCADGEKSTGFLRSLVVDLGVSVVLVKPVDPDEMVRKAGELLSAERTVEEKGDAVQAQMRARLSALWEKFGPTNRERLQWLKSEIADLVEGEDKDESQRREMEREAHKMVGALGTFGFPQATVLAREIELYVSPNTSMAHLDGTKLMEWAQAIERELNAGPQGPPPSTPAEDETGILVVSENKELIEHIQQIELDEKTAKVENVASWARAREIWFLKAPDLVVVDLCGEAADERQTLLNSVAAKLSTIPVVVLLPKEVWNQPDALKRYAGFQVVFHPFEQEMLDGTVKKLLAENNRPKPKVLAVDDDPQILDALTVLLAPLKLDITTLADPLEFWDTLERVQPDLLMLDLDMPFLSGLELCRGVRSNPRWWDLPVLFLSASRDEENLQRIFSVGADDFVPKPFTGPELATRVVNRLVRSAGGSIGEEESDFKSGLDGLRSVLSEERWKNEQVLVALIKVWNADELDDSLGVARVSQLNRQLGVRLAEKLRGVGAVARWRASEFVVAMPGQTLNAGTHLLQSLLEEDEIKNFQEEGQEPVSLTPVAGSTLMKNDTDNLDAALRQCQKNIQFVDGEKIKVFAKEMSDALDQEKAEQCQLLILEPDTATGQKVEELFRRRGYEPRWVADAGDAVQKLTSEPPALEAHAVFISTNGLALLRELRQITNLVNVVVAVNNEQELSFAFDSGAFDCIEKPCQVGSLVKRLERALVN